MQSLHFLLFIMLMPEPDCHSPAVLLQETLKHLMGTSSLFRGQSQRAFNRDAPCSLCASDLNCGWTNCGAASPNATLGDCSPPACLTD